MAGYSETIERLIAELGKLPGIGARAAERLAFHILKSTDDEALALAEAIRDVKLNVRPPVLQPGRRGAVRGARDPRRDRALICVVEQPKDLLALEATGVYRGVYHVLMGHIAPLEARSRGPDAGRSGRSRRAGGIRR